jgi:hypothetical protein
MIDTFMARVWCSAITKRVGVRALIVVALVAVGLLGAMWGPMMATPDIAAAWYPMA